MATSDCSDTFTSVSSCSSYEEKETIDLLQYKNIVILTEGASRTVAAKTAMGLLRYRAEDVASVLDSTESGATAEEVMGVGADVPMIAGLEECPRVDAVFIGISPAGGKLPASWKPVLVDALRRGIDIVSGLHDFMTLDPTLCQVADASGARLIDVRRNNEHSVAQNAWFTPSNLRIHTVGHDCGVGKMVVSLEIQRELQRRGESARFLATGQTGIMISGQGVPVDCVVSDFVNGAVEQLVLRNQDADFLVVEGQGSLSHPSFSGVTTGLLHGCAPQGLVLCYEAGRERVRELEHVRLKPLSELIPLYETVASLRLPSRIIGIAVNGKHLSAHETDLEVARVEKEFGLPACDVWRHGAGKLVDATQALRDQLVPPGLAQ